MSALWINVLKVAFVVVLYLFLWYVARAALRHLAVPATRSPGEQSPVRPAMVAVVGPDGAELRQVEVRGPLVVGRGQADVVLDDPFVSDRHARLDLVGDHLTVEDMRSTNGTLVNDVVIHSRVTLDRGDKIRLGSTTIEVR